MTVMRQHPPSRAPLRALWAAATLLVALPAAAQWTGKGEAGVALASGNSDSRTANARVSAAYKRDAWEHTFGLGGLYVRSEGATTARRWEAGAQTRFEFSASNFWYGGARYEEDRFSGFDHQGLVTTGVGRRFIDNDNTKLLGQVGAGYKFWETLAAPPDKDSSLTGVASLEYSHKLTATTSVFDKFGGEFSSGNNFLQNEVGIAVKMTDRVALALAYAVRHNTNPPVGFEKTDTLTTANLVYEIK
jgi:putative salt-induced outer membrane protein